MAPKSASLFNNAKIDAQANVDDEKTPFTGKNLFKSRNIKIGDTIRYIKNGHSELCTVEPVNMSDLESPVDYTVTLEDSRNTLKAPKKVCDRSR